MDDATRFSHSDLMKASTNTALVPAPRDEAWLKRHEDFVTVANGGGIDVLFLGDSLTDWWRDPAIGRPAWDRYFAGWNAANFGISGDRTQHVLWRLRHGEADGYAPKAVVLLIGTNNTGLENDGRTPRNTAMEAVEGILAVLTELLGRFQDAKILLFALFPRGERDALNRKQVVEINHALSNSICDPRVNYVDIGDEFLASDGSIPEELMPDKLHLSAKGYQIWADAICRSAVFSQ